MLGVLTIRVKSSCKVARGSGFIAESKKNASRTYTRSLSIAKEELPTLRVVSSLAQAGNELRFVMHPRLEDLRCVSKWVSSWL